MNLIWRKGLNGRHELCIREGPDDGVTMAVVRPIDGGRRFHIEYWKDADCVDSEPTIEFNGSLEDAQAYAVTLVRMA